MHCGVHTFKITQILLGVESSLALMYLEIPTTRLCKKKKDT